MRHINTVWGRVASWAFAVGALASACDDDGANQTDSDDGATGLNLTTGADEPTTGSLTGTDGANDDAPTSSDPPSGNPIDVQCGNVGGVNPEDEGVLCFYDVEDTGSQPIAGMEYQLVELDGVPALYLKLTFAPWFVDNTYQEKDSEDEGVLVGWDEHDFGDLEGSDHANIKLADGTGQIVLDFDVDYIQELVADNAPSGFASAGVWEKNGEVHVGDPAAFLAATSSLSRNLNERGYDQYLLSSPPTDELYTPNPEAPNWDYRVSYEVWVDASLFMVDGEFSFAEACIYEVHASPSKTGESTVVVTPDICPPGWGCYLEDGCEPECPPPSSISDDPKNDSDGADDSNDCDPGDPSGGYPPIG